MERTLLDNRSSGSTTPVYKSAINPMRYSQGNSKTGTPSSLRYTPPPIFERRSSSYAITSKETCKNAYEGATIEELIKWQYRLTFDCEHEPAIGRTCLTLGSSRRSRSQATRSKETCKNTCADATGEESIKWQYRFTIDCEHEPAIGRSYQTPGSTRRSRRNTTHTRRNTICIGVTNAP